MPTFEENATYLISRLLVDIPEWNKLDCAACAGNGGGESMLQPVQEGRPISGRGGFGWFQWTGPRRRAFEAWCADNKLDQKSREANYGFLLHELRGPEKKTVARVAAMRTLDTKTVAFEQAYERAGVKRYNERKRLALVALRAFERAGVNAMVTTPSKEVKAGVASISAASAVLAANPTAQVMGKIVNNVLAHQDVPILMKDVQATTEKVMAGVATEVAKKGAALVPVKSGWLSKINWAAFATPLATAASMWLAYKGLDVRPDVVMGIGTLVASIGGAAIVTIRNKFTRSVTPGSIGG